MNILQIIYMAEVAHHNSVSKAAEALYVSQPAVSHQLIKLEEELGLKLFYRSSHGVGLTETGKVFYEHAEKVLKSWNELVIAAKALTRESSDRPLKIWLGPSLYSTGIAEKIMNFEQSFEIECTFHSSFEAIENLYEDIASRKYDIAIDRLQPVYMAKDINQFFISEIAREPVYVMLGQNHPLAKKDEITAADLSPYEPILFTESTGINNIQLELYHQLGINIHPSLQCSSVSESMDLIRRNKAYGIGRKDIAKANHVHTVPFSPEHFITLDFICLAEKKDDPIYRAFYKSIQHIYSSSVSSETIHHE